MVPPRTNGSGSGGSEKLEWRSQNLKILSLNPPGARAFSLLLLLLVLLLSTTECPKTGPLERYIFAFFLFPTTTLAVLYEVKQTQNEDKTTTTMALTRV